VIGSFADATTEDLFNGVNSRAARRIPPTLWPVVRRKLDLLKRVTRVEALRIPPGNRLERLRGARAGSYSIRVNEQYRITFRFREGHAYDVCCEDYHA
jgi:proteic killer suppression protein